MHWRKVLTECTMQLYHYLWHDHQVEKITQGAAGLEVKWFVRGAVCKNPLLSFRYKLNLVQYYASVKPTATLYIGNMSIYGNNDIDCRINYFCAVPVPGSSSTCLSWMLVRIFAVRPLWINVQLISTNDCGKNAPVLCNCSLPHKSHEKRDIANRVAEPLNRGYLACMRGVRTVYTHQMALVPNTNTPMWTLGRTAAPGICRG